MAQQRHKILNQQFFFLLFFMDDGGDSVSAHGSVILLFPYVFLKRSSIAFYLTIPGNRYNRAALDK